MSDGVRFTCYPLTTLIRHPTSNILHTLNHHRSIVAGKNFKNLSLPGPEPVAAALWNRGTAYDTFVFRGYLHHWPLKNKLRSGGNTYPTLVPLMYSTLHGVERIVRFGDGLWSSTIKIKNSELTSVSLLFRQYLPTPRPVSTTSLTGFFPFTNSNSLSKSLLHAYLLPFLNS